mmetsp:Transcript_28425/g.39669  ORF Transcript_28425/g.39669 Transcript_28425/m.39669 type:complete len:90 (-) Transcript_28425:594-863(-)
MELIARNDNRPVHGMRALYDRTEVSRRTARLSAASEKSKRRLGNLLQMQRVHDTDEHTREDSDHPSKTGTYPTSHYRSSSNALLYNFQA